MGGGKTNLEETNVGGLLTEALTADVHLNEKYLVSPAYPSKRTQFEKGSGEIHTPYLRIRPARWEQTRLSEKISLITIPFDPICEFPVQSSSVQFEFNIHCPFSSLLLSCLSDLSIHPSVHPSFILSNSKKPRKDGVKKNQGKKLNTPLTGTLAVTIQNTLVSS